MTQSGEQFSHPLNPGERERLKVLQRTALSELEHLQQTDQRLFAQTWSVEVLAEKMRDIDFAERVDAFVARFGRLQDLLGDKYLPAWLKAMQEAPGAVLENLDRAEKLGLMVSADQWLAVRKLRNLMVHEYLDQIDTLHMALTKAHEQVPMLAHTTQRLVERTQPLL